MPKKKVPYVIDIPDEKPEKLKVWLNSHYVKLYKNEDTQYERYREKQKKNPGPGNLSAFICGGDRICEIRRAIAYARNNWNLTESEEQDLKSIEVKLDFTEARKERRKQGKWDMENVKPTKEEPSDLRLLIGGDPFWNAPRYGVHFKDKDVDEELERFPAQYELKFDPAKHSRKRTKAEHRYDEEYLERYFEDFRNHRKPEPYSPPVKKVRFAESTAFFTSMNTATTSFNPMSKFI